MKTKVLIIEDNYYKYFTTKQLLESQLRVEVEVITVGTTSELADRTKELDPDVVLFRPVGGVQDLLDKLKRRNINRRNTSVTLLVAQDLDDDLVRGIQQHLASARLKKPACAA